MNSQLAKLFAIAKKPSRKVIGLMSGTSVDGLDVAVCQVSGSGKDTELKLDFFKTVSYNPAQKKLLQQLIRDRSADLENICVMNEWIGKLQAEIILTCLAEWNISVDDIDLIASHGQTIYHAPAHQHRRAGFPNGSLQLGDGDHIAVNTGIITISDFRQKHLAAGGEGAPLAAYGDFILFAKDDENIILLNIGGIANFTFIPAGRNFGKIICSDTGPGNTLMDGYAQQQFPGQNFDEAGEIASRGQVNERLLGALSSHNFFNLPFPKTTGREIFNSGFLKQALLEVQSTEIPPQDVMATLNYFSCLMISKGIRSASTGHSHCRILVSGGGMHNLVMMENLRKLLPGFEIGTTSGWNINPDAKEAILFAILANEMVSGNGESFVNANSAMPAVTMGKISLPA